MSISRLLKKGTGKRYGGASAQDITGHCSEARYIYWYLKTYLKEALSAPKYHPPSGLSHGLFGCSTLFLAAIKAAVGLIICLMYLTSLPIITCHGHTCHQPASNGTTCGDQTIPITPAIWLFSCGQVDLTATVFHPHTVMRQACLSNQHRRITTCTLSS